MKRVLAIDTSGRTGSVALVESGQLIAEARGDSQGDHATRLLGWIESSLAEAGWSRTEIDLYAGVRGPGSFTGIRIGLGVITGLAMAAERPCVGISGLAAAAWAAHDAGERGRVLVAFGAGRGELYVEGFDLTSGVTTRWFDAVAIEEPALARTAIEADVPLLLRPVDRELGERLRECAPSLRVGTLDASFAAPAARLALEAAEPLEPLYLRAPDAIARPRGSR